MHESAKVEAGSTEPTFTPVVARRPELRRAPLAGRRAVILGGMLWVAAIGAVGAAAFTVEHLFTHSQVARPTDIWLPPDDEQWADALVVPSTVAGGAVEVAGAAVEADGIAVLVEQLGSEPAGPPAPVGSPARQASGPIDADRVDPAGGPLPPSATTAVPIVADPDVPVAGTSTTAVVTSTTSPSSEHDGGSSGPDEGPSTSTSGPTTTTRPATTSASNSDDDGGNSGPGSGGDSGNSSGSGSGSSGSGGDSGSNSGPGGGDGRRP